MTGYYNDKLAAERLRQCYGLAPERTRQYLQAELDFTLSHIKSGDIVLDLGCGYGRTLPLLAAKAGSVVGIDNAAASIAMARKAVKDIPNIAVKEMDAARLLFAANLFDVVICIQNGISAFHCDQKSLLREALRVTKPGGLTLFSTYAEKFWEYRLEWFKLQAAAGLLGEIDWGKTANGIIVCQDGFTASTISPKQFNQLTAGLPAKFTLTEVDESSLFCELRKNMLNSII
jgi:2-polyprenyl-6-hydroxyphenyl methylase/3-demethylubiquinone-9 3-methyltransferase